MSLTWSHPRRQVFSRQGPLFLFELMHYVPVNNYETHCQIINEDMSYHTFIPTTKYLMMCKVYTGVGGIR